MKNDQQSRAEREIPELLAERGFVEIGATMPADRVIRMFLNSSLGDLTGPVATEIVKINRAGRVEGDCPKPGEQFNGVAAGNPRRGAISSALRALACFVLQACHRVRVHWI